MNKNELLNEISNSKKELKKHNLDNKVNKEDLSEIIFKIINNEPLETQRIINLYYMDELEPKDIAYTMGIDEITVLYHFQLILFKIKLILNPNTESKYKASNYSGKVKKSEESIKKGSLLDKKS